MEKKITYPNYSVYIVSGTSLKIPYSRSKRVILYDRYEALRAMVNVAVKFKCQAVILEYTDRWQSKIIDITDASSVKVVDAKA